MEFHARLGGRRAVRGDVDTVHAVDGDDWHRDVLHGTVGGWGRRDDSGGRVDATDVAGAGCVDITGLGEPGVGAFLVE